MLRALTRVARSGRVIQPGPKNVAQQFIKRNLAQTSVFRSGDLNVVYKFPSGEEIKVKAKEGENLLDIAIENDIQIDGFGACEGTLACSTCHLIFSQEDFDKISDVSTDEELDMLDLAFGLTDTSRLGCQVCMNKAMDGIVARVPDEVNDQR